MSTSSGTKKQRGEKRSVKDRADGRLPTGRHGLSPEEVVQSQKQRLMDAMAELAAEKGYHSTTIAELVTRAGVSRATYYEIFEDKEACFVATMMEGARRLGEAVYPSLANESPEWGDRVESVVEALLSYLAKDPSYSTTAMVEAQAGGEKAYEIYNIGTSMIMNLLGIGREYLPEGFELPECTERVVVGGGEWLIAGEMMEGRVDRVYDLLADYIYIAVLPYIGQQAALERMDAAAERGRR